MGGVNVVPSLVDCLFYFREHSVCVKLECSSGYNWHLDSIVESHSGYFARSRLLFVITGNNNWFRWFFWLDMTFVIWSHRVNRSHWINRNNRLCLSVLITILTWVAWDRVNWCVWIDSVLRNIFVMSSFLLVSSLFSDFGTMVIDFCAESNSVILKV